MHVPCTVPWGRHLSLHNHTLHTETCGSGRASQGSEELMRGPGPGAGKSLGGEQGTGCQGLGGNAMGAFGSFRTRCFLEFHPGGSNGARAGGPGERIWGTLKTTPGDGGLPSRRG